MEHIEDILDRMEPIAMNSNYEISKVRHELLQVVRSLPDGDVARLLAFAKEMKRVREGKREKRNEGRSSRVEKLKPVVEDWRIGN